MLNDATQNKTYLSIGVDRCWNVREARVSADDRLLPSPPHTGAVIRTRARVCPD